MDAPKTRKAKTVGPAEMKVQQVERSELVRRTPYTTEEVLNLIDYYEDFEGQRNSDIAGEAENHAPEAHEPPDEDAEVPYSVRTEGYDLQPPETATVVTDLTELLVRDDSTPEDIFECYTQLPKPGIQHLNAVTRMYLVRRLSVLRHKTAVRTMNFFSIIDDYKLAGMRIPIHAWNSAIHLGGKTTRRPGDPEVETALRTWREMEADAGRKGDVVTFNILLDTSIKAGKHGLAQLIRDEMKSRGLRVDAFTRLSDIFAHGIRGDGAGVRNEYRDFVEAGEIVDSTVLTCMIASLVNCGEPEAAESVFHRMMTLAIEREGKTYGPKLWSKARELTQILKWVVHSGLFRSDAREKLQSAISLSPNIRTCNTLLSHFCKTGELHRAVEMLDHMQRLGISPNTRTFMLLVQGFHRHGGLRYSMWTGARLEAVWSSYVKLLGVEDLDLHLTKWMALRVLEAFRKCCGAQKELEIWEELKSRWKQDMAFEVIAPRPEHGLSSWGTFHR